LNEFFALFGFTFAENLEMRGYANMAVGLRLGYEVAESCKRWAELMGCGLSAEAIQKATRSRISPRGNVLI
jgi:hypothetical protein